MEAYLKANQDYWQQGYPAENVDHPVFRGLWGRLLKHEHKHLHGGRLLDFGCGQGANTAFMHGKGFEVHGVDICEPDIMAAQRRFPKIARAFTVCEPHPNDNLFYGWERDIAVVMGIQAFYYFTDTDLDLLLTKLHASMKPGALIFATMMGVESEEFFKNATPDHDGLFRVNYENKRMVVKDYCISFVESEAHMKRKFHRFKALHCGYYAAKFREDEGDGFHRTFLGIKE
jgi:SAM-dependent methyltransferase